MEEAFIESVFFDHGGNFAGLKIKDNKDGFFKTSSAKLRSNELVEEFNELRDKDINAHTRIVGFRTTKACRQSKLIRSL